MPSDTLQSVMRARPQLVRLAFSTLNDMDEAEIAADEALSRFLETSFEEGNALSFLKGITSHVAVDMLRKRIYGNRVTRKPVAWCVGCKLQMKYGGCGILLKWDQSLDRGPIYGQVGKCKRSGWRTGVIYKLGHFGGAAHARMDAGLSRDDDRTYHQVIATPEPDAYEVLLPQRLQIPPMVREDLYVWTLSNLAAITDGLVDVTPTSEKIAWTISHMQHIPALENPPTTTAQAVRHRQSRIAKRLATLKD